MTKKHFIALADVIRGHNRIAGTSCHGISAFNKFTDDQLRTLSIFCKTQNYNFDTGRWLDYIAGKCGKNGGKVNLNEE